MLADGIERLSELQQRLYADDRWSVLIVLQAMDAAGKEHVLSGINPQGCEVHGFKQPSAEALQHDFLWRVARRLPTNGRIGIFNRSHNEEVLTVRMHKELLARNGTRILKFFLNVSKDEQRRRFLARIDERAKRWKFSMSDFAERKLWDRYMVAYEDMIQQTSTPEAPWFVVPADHKWFTRIVVAAALVQEMQALDLDYPKVDGKALKELRKSEKALRREKSSLGRLLVRRSGNNADLSSGLICCTSIR